MQECKQCKYMYQRGDVFFYKGAKGISVPSKHTAYSLHVKNTVHDTSDNVYDMMCLAREVCKDLYAKYGIERADVVLNSGYDNRLKGKEHQHVWVSVAASSDKDKARYDKAFKTVNGLTGASDSHKLYLNPYSTDIVKTIPCSNFAVLKDPMRIVRRESSTTSFYVFATFRQGVCQNARIAFPKKN